MNYENCSFTKKDDTILTFDTIYTTNSIQLIKLMLPLFEPSSRPLLATIVKILELSYCYTQLKECNITSIKLLDEYFDQYIREAQKYCSSEQLFLFRSLSQMRNMIKVFDKFDFSFSENPFSQESLFKNYLSKDQQSIFEKYRKQFQEE